MATMQGGAWLLCSVCKLNKICYHLQSVPLPLQSGEMAEDSIVCSMWAEYQVTRGCNELYVGILPNLIGNLEYFEFKFGEYFSA